MSSPLLSICIPTYNRCSRLDLLLESLVAQITELGADHPVEIVVSDNASSDQTREVADKWAAQYPFIRYFRNSWNIGGDPNQLRAISRGTGKFVWLLGDDDRVRKGAVSRILSYLKPAVSQLFLDFRCMTLDGECLSPARLHAGIPDEITTVELIKRIGYVSVFALISSHVFDRERFLAADPFSLLKISPWYVINTCLIMAFHDDPCVLVRDPVLDYIAGNDRLPDETTLYVRVIGVLNTLKILEEKGKIAGDFLFGVYETGAGDRWTLKHPHYFREELYGNLLELANYWALPGRADAQLVRNFINRGPGFWELRHRLESFFTDDFRIFRNRKKPVIHFWHGKTWVPAFTLLYSSDVSAECAAFDQLAGKWPEEFAHESVLISRVPEDQFSFQHLDVFMAPYRRHGSPSASLNSGFRKALGQHVFVLDEVNSPALPDLIKVIDEWQRQKNAPNACLIFESSGEKSGKLPARLLGLFVHRETLVRRGGFENCFHGWSRHRLLADAGFRLKCQACAIDGGKISRECLDQWFAAELPSWQRILRRIRRGPVSEHGLNITRRAHLARLCREAEAEAPSKLRGS